MMPLRALHSILHSQGASTSAESSNESTSLVLLFAFMRTTLYEKAEEDCVVSQEQPEGLFKL